MAVQLKRGPGMKMMQNSNMNDWYRQIISYCWLIITMTTLLLPLQLPSPPVLLMDYLLNQRSLQVRLYFHVCSTLWIAAVRCVQAGYSYRQSPSLATLFMDWCLFKAINNYNTTTNRFSAVHTGRFVSDKLDPCLLWETTKAVCHSEAIVWENLCSMHIRLSWEGV